MKTSDMKFDKDIINEYATQLESVLSHPKGYGSAIIIVEELLKFPLTLKHLQVFNIGKNLQKIKVEGNFCSESQKLKSLAERLFKESQVRSKIEKENLPKETCGERKTQTLKLIPDFRNNILKFLIESLICDYIKTADELKQRNSALKFALEIEKTIFEKFGKLEFNYKKKGADLIHLIKALPMEHLRKSILQGEVTDFGALFENPEQFYNYSQKQHLEEKKKRALDSGSADYSKRNILESQLHQCDACGSKKISTMEKQILAGDEPMTSFYTCVECDYSWQK